MQKLLVIIVTYNAMQWADRCFSSLTKSSFPNEVFVVDNGSNDGTQEFIQKNYPSVIFHQSIENLGFGKANNMGFKYALDNGFDFVYLLNQDAWVEHDVFQKLIEVFNTNPEFGILSPLQFNRELTKLDAAFYNCCRCNKSLLGNLHRESSRRVYPVNMVMAAHWMISSPCLKTVGGFSPLFYHYGEDNNYVDRAFFWNYRIGIVPNAKAVHDRELRPMPIEKAYHINLVNEYGILANPTLDKRRILWPLYFLKHLFKLIRQYHRVGYVLYLFKVIYAYPKVAEYRAQSKSQGAFL